MFRQDIHDSDIVHQLLDDVLPTGRRLLLMLKAYLDYGSKEQAEGIMCVAASLFTPTKYRQWCQRWTPMVRGWNAKAFHATDFYTGGGEFWRQRPDGTIDKERMNRFERDSKRIPGIIAAKVHHQFIMSFKADEFEAVAPSNWRAHFGGVHGVAVQMVLQAIGHWADREKFHGNIAYFLESGDEAQNEINVHLTRYQSDPKLRAHARFASYTWADKGKVRGLEASDFLAWQWNKFYADSVAAVPPRDPRKDLRALVEMLHAGKQRLNTTLFTGKGLTARGASRHGLRDTEQSATESPRHRETKRISVARCLCGRLALCLAGRADFYHGLLKDFLVENGCVLKIVTVQGLYN